MMMAAFNRDYGRLVFQDAKAPRIAKENPTRCMEKAINSGGYLPGMRDTKSTNYPALPPPPIPFHGPFPQGGRMQAPNIP